MSDSVVIKSFLIILFVILNLNSGDDYEMLRMKMVRDQIENRGITDKLTLDALSTVPRHKFVHKDLTNRAYSDGPLPIGHGQTISQPYIVAYMTSVIHPKKGQKVLEIGTGSGYQAAILSKIVDTVCTIEIIEELHKNSTELLNSLGYDNIFTQNSDGYYGWIDYAPFDAIIVTAASEFIPPPLIEQLKDGGRMIIPVGTPFLTQMLTLVEKRDNQIFTTGLLPVRFVPFTRKN